MDDRTIERTDPRFLAAARGDTACDLALTGGRVADVFRRGIIEADVGIIGGRIAAVVDPNSDAIDALDRVDCSGLVLAPGFIDAHMHVESSMLPPTRFAALASPHGTTAAVFDPHEIANVCGAAGIRWLADDASRACVDALIALSSCVPSSPLESAGASLDADDLRSLFDDAEIGPRVVALAEVMNFPGVVNGDPGVLAKVRLGLERAVVDGHAPGLGGRALQAYAGAGVSTDHECTTREEAEEKLALGQRIAIREGSAAQNLRALIGLVNESNAHRFLFCTDDRHPGDLRDRGHIDHAVRMAVAEGVPAETAIAIATINAAEHYRRPDLGAIAPGRCADIIALTSLASLRVERTWFRGALVAEGGRFLGEVPPLQPWPASAVRLPDGFGPEMLAIDAPSNPGEVRVIGMHAESLVTDALRDRPRIESGKIVADPERDLLKIAVIERHAGTGRLGLGLVKNFRFRGGAIASTVGHDAHNLAVVGDNDRDMALAARTVAEAGGGQCVVSGGEVVAVLPLPIAGLMSDAPAEQTIERQHTLLDAARDRLGCPHADPFMPLSFLPLPVIPHLKLTDLGLVDVDAFAVVGLTI